MKACASPHASKHATMPNAALAALPRVACIALAAIVILSAMGMAQESSRAYAEDADVIASEQTQEEAITAEASTREASTTHEAPSPRAATFSIPPDAQKSGTTGGCTWFIRSATDPSNPGQFVLYPTNGVSGAISYKSHPAWYFMTYLIKTAYIAPGVKVTDSGYGFFRDADSMTYADVGNLDVSSCTDLWSFFRGCENLVRVDGLEKWDVSSIGDVRQLFLDCSSLSEVDLSSWEVGKNVTDELIAFSFFEGCKSLRKVGDLSQWNLAACESLSGFFLNCSSLESVPGLNCWNTRNVTSFYRTFYRAGMSELDISSWETSQALDMKEMFFELGGKEMRSITVGPGFDFEPSGLPQGEWSNEESRVSFPVLSGQNAEGKTHTGRWVADGTEIVHNADAIPNKTADTYRPELVSLGTLELSGEEIVGETITANLKGSSGVEPVYSWFRSASSSGPWKSISDAEGDLYTLRAADAGMYVKCVVTDASGVLEGSVSAISGCILKPRLAGNAFLVGSYVYGGGSLSARVENAPENAMLSYSWYTGPERGSTETLVGTGANYAVSKEDVGRFITCVVSDASGAYEGTIVAEGACVTVTLSLAVPDRLRGTLSGSGEIAWQEFGSAFNESSCAVRITTALSSVSGQESAVCSLQGTVLQPQERALIAWNGLGRADSSLYEKAALASGAYIDAGALTYAFEAA